VEQACKLEGVPRATTPPDPRIPIATMAPGGGGGKGGGGDSVDRLAEHLGTMSISATSFRVEELVLYFLFITLMPGVE